MHLKTKSVGASRNVGARLKDATDTVLGTGAESAKSAYDMRSGALLTFILLFVAGWIPMFGQMIAGYVGGRKAGSPYRGFGVTAFATLCMLLLLVIVSGAVDAIDGALASDPDAEIAAIKESSPFLGQLTEATVGYLQGIFGNSNLSINVGMYMLTVVFGIVGGVMADQSRKETRLIIAEFGKVNGRRHRSIDYQKKGRSMAFETYEDYKSMSVNAMPMQTRKRPVKRQEPKESIVTGTVDTTPIVMSTATTTSSCSEKGPSEAPIEVQETRKEPREERRPAEEEDISDCI